MATVAAGAASSVAVPTAAELAETLAGAVLGVPKVESLAAMAATAAREVGMGERRRHDDRSDKSHFVAQWLALCTPPGYQNS